MTVRSAFTNVVSSKLPPALVMAIQVAFSCLVSFLLAHLALLIGHLTPTELSLVWVPLTGAYFAGVQAAEERWPAWIWLLQLLPSQLPGE